MINEIISRIQYNLAANKHQSDLWEQHIQYLVSEMNRWFCWNRLVKFMLLCHLVRIGSSYVEHNQTHPDRRRWLDRMEPAYEVLEKFAPRKKYKPYA